MTVVYVARPWNVECVVAGLWRGGSVTVGVGGWRERWLKWSVLVKVMLGRVERWVFGGGVEWSVA